MKVKSSAFLSQCKVLTFPWMGRQRKTVEEPVYTQILTFPPPVMTPAVSEGTFPLIQMMDGKEPVVWEAPGSVTSQTEETQRLAPAQRSAKSLHRSAHTAASGTGQSGKTLAKGKIPRPKNAFILYRSHVSQMLKEAMAFKVRESNISSLVSEMWKKESEVVHAYYAKRAALEWVQYMKRVQKDRCMQTAEDANSTRSPTPSAMESVGSVGSMGSMGSMGSIGSVGSAEPATLGAVEAPVVTTGNATTPVGTAVGATPGTPWHQTPPAFSSPNAMGEEKVPMTPFTEAFFSNVVYGSPSDTTHLGMAGTETSTLLSSSPRSSNEDFFDVVYPVNAMAVPTEKPACSFTEKTHPMTFLPPLTTAPMVPSLKDSAFSMVYDMNPLDMGYGYTMPNPLVSTPMHPYVVGTGLGLEPCMRWPDWASTPTAWPVHM